MANADGQEPGVGVPLGATMIAVIMTHVSVIFFVCVSMEIQNWDSGPQSAMAYTYTTN